MPISRYKNRKIITNDFNSYREILEKRGAKQITHFGTPKFSFDDSVEEYPFDFIEHIWKDGDRLYKLSNKYYNSTQFWWVIAFINQKPTDSDYEIGDLVLIPDPLEQVLDFIGFKV